MARTRDAADKLLWYPMYPRDFSSDEHVVVMSLEAEGAYRRLLDHQWLHGSIPADLDALAAICKQIPGVRMRRLWERIAPCFRTLSDDPSRMQNGRMERVRGRRDGAVSDRSDSGKAGADSRWGDAERFVYAMHRGSDGAIKIGWSRNPNRRAFELARELGCDMTVIAMASGGPKLERQSQLDLAEHRIGTEYFRDCDQVRHWIEAHLTPCPDGITTGAPQGTAGAPRCTNGITETETETELTTPKPLVWELDFDVAWTAYPKRPGNPRKAALRAYLARRKEGVTAGTLLAGVRAYAAHCKRQGTDPKYVKLAATFFGPDEHYLADFGPVEESKHWPYLNAQGEEDPDGDIPNPKVFGVGR